MSSADIDHSAEENVKRRKIETWYPVSIRSIEKPLEFASTTHISDVPSSIKLNQNKNVVLGVDEAGRGPVLGPMVYGIAYCLEDYETCLRKEYGFVDSKVVKPEKRKELFQLVELGPLFEHVGWACTTMTARDISSGMLSKLAYNLNEQAHDTTIALIKQVLAQGVQLSKIFVDTVGPPTTYQAKLQKVFPDIEVTVTKKADSLYPIVSTASMVAKVTRDYNLEYFCEKLGYSEIGCGYPSDPLTKKWQTANIDKVFGWNFGITRFSWQTSKDCLVKNGGVNVIYESDCIKEPGYQDIGSMFNKKEGFNSEHYGSDSFKF